MNPVVFQDNGTWTCKVHAGTEYGSAYIEVAVNSTTNPTSESTSTDASSEASTSATDTNQQTQSTTMSIATTNDASTVTEPTTAQGQCNTGPKNVKLCNYRNNKILLYTLFSLDSPLISKIIPYKLILSVFNVTGGDGNDSITTEPTTTDAKSTKEGSATTTDTSITPTDNGEEESTGTNTRLKL